ncbi:SLBB domain-containing protein [Phenylobacterium sp.]|uniref:SLBB domain-containing protein n=1 Tax=Phenylobacterium sp. TaxID=1871053 RepID=UPI0025F60ACB|nr:SLBB domain-containing protein [Phenylobacterium sp.]
MMLALVFVLAAPLAAFAQPVPAAPAAAPTAAIPPAATPPAASLFSTDLAGDRQYTLGIGDTIEVAVVGRSDFNGRARIGSDGAVLLPFLGAVPATNRTPGQLADEVRAALEKGGYFSNPVVRIDVVGVASRYVTILGAVGAPGLMALDRRYRLSEILARAGGKSEAGVDYVILTPETGASKQYKMADLATGSGEQDPYVNNGDKIYVPAAQTALFYITGQVKNPGSYPVTEGLTLRMALARAGGLTESGSDKKVKINRKGETVKSVKLDETIVEPSDILTVGERLF